MRCVTVAVQYLDGWVYKRNESQSADLGARLNVRGVEQPLMAGLYADDTVLLAGSEGMLQRIVYKFDSVCKRRKLTVNAGKSRIMVFERAREQTVDFAKLYRVGSEVIHGCKMWLGKERME